MSDVIITGTVDQTVIKRIHRLFSTPVGSIPFNREFGVDLTVLDNAPAAVEGALMVEYSRKMLKFFPDYIISRIDFKKENNQITPMVVISNA